MATMIEDGLAVGKCDIGNVFVYHFAGSPQDNGSFAEHRYEVRAGDRTVATRANREVALRIATSLCAPDVPEVMAKT